MLRIGVKNFIKEDEKFLQKRKLFPFILQELIQFWFIQKKKIWSITLFNLLYKQFEVFLIILFNVAYRVQRNLFQFFIKKKDFTFFILS